MTIAIPTIENNVNDHFGNATFYTIFNIENNKITERRIIKAPEGCGCKSEIAPILASYGVTLMLIGNIGIGAINVLKNNNIAVLRGCSGNIETIIQNYIDGNMIDNGTTCEHHNCNH